MIIELRLSPDQSRQINHLRRRTGFWRRTGCPYPFRSRFGGSIRRERANASCRIPNVASPVFSRSAPSPSRFPRSPGRHPIDAANLSSIGRNGGSSPAYPDARGRSWPPVVGGWSPRRYLGRRTGAVGRCKPMTGGSYNRERSPKRRRILVPAGRREWTVSRRTVFCPTDGFLPEGKGSIPTPCRPSRQLS